MRRKGTRFEGGHLGDVGDDGPLVASAHVVSVQCEDSPGCGSDPGRKYPSWPLNVLRDPGQLAAALFILQVQVGRMQKDRRPEKERWNQRKGYSYDGPKRTMTDGAKAFCLTKTANNRLMAAGWRKQCKIGTSHGALSRKSSADILQAASHAIRISENN